MKGVAMAFVVLLAPWLGMAASGEGPRDEVAEIHKRARENPDDDAAVRRYLDTLPRVGDRYVVEGDLLRTEAQLREALGEPADPESAPRGGELLVVLTADGVPKYWPPGRRDLTYSVDRDSFRNLPEYDAVVANLASSTKDWEAACQTCGLTFRHDKAQDADPKQGAVTFIVRMEDAGGAFIATAFFPNDSPTDRLLRIEPSYFETGFDKVGVLRHELGHVLGYRHEHIVGIRGCYREDNQWLPLTPYDPRSVMHYLCGGGGDREFRITDLDREGHRRLYGED